MSRIIYIPQFPAKMRYSEWWFERFPEEFMKAGHEVVTLGKTFPIEDHSKIYTESFSPIQMAVEFESYQINEFMSLRLRDDDILFLADTSFPGLFTNILYHKKPKFCFAFCHGTSKNKLDYFQATKKEKWATECAQAKIFDRIFVASNYHADKLRWPNLRVIGLPVYNNNLKLLSSRERKNDIVTVARHTPQKITKKVEKYIEKCFGKKIERQIFNEWGDYFSYLMDSKILLISSKEDTFNYSILDAISCGCIPVAPYRCAFPEILPSEYLYDDKYEAFIIISQILEGELGLPTLLCQERIDNFFKSLLTEVKHFVERF